jgi:mono/diheme cytochrome c family protein
MYNKLKNMNKVLILFSLIVLMILSCGRSPEDTGRTYVPDMQYSSAYEPYAPGPNVEGSSLNDGLSAREPVKGTIPRGHLTYHLEDTDEDREKSKAITSPIEKSDKSLAKGKHLYNIYCGVCHGEKGDGNGVIVANGEYKPVPTSYLEGRGMELTEGEIYHAITYGKNMMGHYRAQLDSRERWVVTQYVQSLQKKAKGE